MGSFNLGRSEEAVRDEQLASLDLPKLKQADVALARHFPVLNRIRHKLQKITETF